MTNETSHSNLITDVSTASVTLDPATFPDKPKGDAKRLPATMENFLHLIAGHGIVIRFNQMRKEAEVDIPGLNATPQNRENVTETYLESLMIKYGMSPAGVGRYILATADRNSYDPFADWINSKPWDGTKRLADICNTITPADEYPPSFACQLIIKWLLSIVAATFYGPGFHCRGTPEQEAELSTINARYEVVGAVGEKIAAQVNLDRRGEANLPRMRAGEVLHSIGIERPTNMQSKEANAMLRSLLGRPKRIKGINYWDVPWTRPEDLELMNETY